MISSLLTKKSLVHKIFFNIFITVKKNYNLRSIVFLPFTLGLFLPFSFAPFHFPVLAILSLTFIYRYLLHSTRHAFLKGLFFGLGFFGLGISWVFVSISTYGQTNIILAIIITILFLLYLSLFTACQFYLFNRLLRKKKYLYNCLVFSSLWVIFEYVRANLFTGLPWLQLGTGQIDAPIKYLLPIIGTYGLSFITCLIATFLSNGCQLIDNKRYFFISAAFFFYLLPLSLQNIQWSQNISSPLQVSAIQINVDIRNKWDENKFHDLLAKYDHDLTNTKKADLTVLPESAIPLPKQYVTNFLTKKHQQALKNNSAIILGIPATNDNNYYNSLITLGHANGRYFKQHLVPFGEYIPKFWQSLIEKLAIPIATLTPGSKSQKLIKIHNRPIATLLCYELAYSQILRAQLPTAEFIVSASDNGWFGRSFAMYQQQQIAQVRSMETSRYQILANNDGLSSVFNAHGEIINELPAHSAGILHTKLYRNAGVTPWVIWGDKPILILNFLIIIIAIIIKIKYKLTNYIITLPQTSIAN